MLKAVILDDELSGIEILSYDLNTYCPDVQVIAAFQNPHEAASFLTSCACDVLFLDIDMPACNGFDFLKNFTNINFEVIFVTAYEEYALRAFDFYALDYLLKPVQEDRLRRAIERIKTKKRNLDDFEKFETLFKNINSGLGKNQTLAIPTLEGFEIIELAELVFLKADGNYTELILKTKKLVVSKNLGDFEKVLPVKEFLRIHHSFIVSVSQIKRYIKGDGGMVSMANGEQLPVSRINKPKLLSLLNLPF